MKRLNVKLLLILVITVVVLSTGVAVVHAIQMNRNSDSLIKRAEAAKTSGDTTQAIWYYRRYLSNKPQDLERYAEYALLTAGNAEKPQSTLQEFTGALRDLQNVLLNDRGRHEARLSDKNRTDVQHKLIDLELMSRNIQLISSAKTLLLEMKAKGETTPADDLKLAQCQSTLGNYQEAVKLLESLLGYNVESKSFDSEKAPAATEVEAYILLAGLLRDKITDNQVSDRQEVADRVMDQLVSINKDSVKAYLGRARYLQRFSSRDKAKPDIEKALELAPNDSDVLMQAAEMATVARDFATAESLIKKGIKENPKVDRLYLGFAMLAKFQDKKGEAKERLEAGLQELPTSSKLLQMLLEMQLEDRDAQGARVTMQKLAATDYPSVLKEYREAQVLMLEGKMLDASQKLEKLRPQLGKSPEFSQQGDYTLQTDYMLMQCYLSLGLQDLALTTSRRLAAESQNAFEAELGIAASLKELGKTAEAKAQYEKLLTIAPAAKQQAYLPQICGALVDLHIAEQLRLPVDSRDWKSVEAYLADLKERELVKEPAASLMLSNILAHKGDSAGSRKLLDQMVAQNPDNITLLRARVENSFQEHKPEEALKLINSAPEKLRGDASLQLGRIDAILQSNTNKEDTLKALEALSAKIGKEKLSDSVLSQMHFGIGMAYLRQDAPEKCLQEWDQSADLQPHSARIRWMIFNLAREMSKPDVIKHMREWFVGEYGRDSSQAQFSDAVQLVLSVRQDQRTRAADSHQLDLSEANKASLQRARDILRNVENLRPDWDERPKLLAEIDGLEGKPDEEIADLREVLKLGAPSQAVVKRLAQLLLIQKRYAEVKEVVSTYGSESDKGLDRIAAVNDQYSGRPDLALAKLESSLSKDSKNPIDHLYHGQLLASVGKMDQAEAELRQATELGPQRPETWLALVYFLRANGKIDDARKAVQDAEIQLPEDRRGLAIAQGYEIVGDQMLADQYFQSALDAAPTDLNTRRQVAGYYLRNKRYNLAKPLIEELLKIKPTTPADTEVLSWARRSMAQMLAGQGGYQNFQKALEYLEPLPGEKPSVADLSIKASLLGTRSDVASARLVLDTLPKLKEMRALTVEQRTMLAHAYERVGDWTAAQNEMLSILEQPNASPASYVTMIEMLLRRNSPADAVTWLKKMQTSARASPLIMITLTSHILVSQGRGKEAAANMLRLLPAERPLPQDKVELLRMIADLTTQLGQFDEAEKMWREYVTYRPEQAISLATFLALRGKVDEALQIADKNRKASSLVATLAVASAAAKQQIHPLTAEQKQHVEEWFNRALRDDPDSIQVQILWADYLDTQGRYDEMEKVYRSILSRTDVGPNERAGVANNLAFALATQGRQLDEALKLSQDTIAQLGPVAEALDTRGLVYLAKGDTTQAIHDLKDAVSVLDPQSITFVHLAMAQAAAKDMSSARHSLDKAKELKFNPDEMTSLDRKKYDTLVEQLNKPS